MLKKELNQSNKAKREAERSLEQLKQQYISAKVTNEEEMERDNSDQQELRNLRKIKAQLQREKDLCKKECDKLENELQSCVKERTEIELNAKNLSEKLEVVQAEKAMLEKDFNKNQNTIDRYNSEIAQLKSELNNMKNVIANTFEEELQSAESMNATGGRKRKPVKK